MKSKTRTNIITIAIVVVMAAIVIIMIFGTRKKKETELDLKHIASVINSHSGDIPTEISALSAWGNENGRFNLLPRTAAGLLCDRWTQPIVLILENGRISGLASKGPNGEWNKGHDDDIVIWLKDFPPPACCATSGPSR